VQGSEEPPSPLREVSAYTYQNERRSARHGGFVRRRCGNKEVPEGRRARQEDPTSGSTIDPMVSVFHLTLEQGHGFWTMVAVGSVAIALAAHFHRRVIAQLSSSRWRQLLALRGVAILLVVLLLFRPVLSLDRSPSVPKGSAREGAWAAVEERAGLMSAGSPRYPTKAARASSGSVTGSFSPGLVRADSARGAAEIRTRNGSLAGLCRIRLSASPPMGYDSRPCSLPIICRTTPGELTPISPP